MILCDLTKATFTQNVLALVAALGLSGCVSSSYAGISLQSGSADPGLEALARRAQVGDKYAQLELGIRYEEGSGVTRDLRRAQALYALAAKQTGGIVWTYVPGVKGAKGYPLAVSTGPVQVGIPEAASRLERLRLRAREVVPK